MPNPGFSSLCNTWAAASLIGLLWGCLTAEDGHPVPTSSDTATHGSHSGNAGAGGPAGVASGAAGATSSSTTSVSSCVASVNDMVPGSTAVCAQCLCSKCNAQSSAVIADTKAEALVICGLRERCSGGCCLCNRGGSDCSATSCTGYGDGPCAAETLKAAGGAYPSDASSCMTNPTGAAQVRSDCQKTGNACRLASDFGLCSGTQCAAECGEPIICPPSR